MLNEKMLNNLVALIENDQIQELKNQKLDCEPNIKNCKVTATTKKKYTLVDISNSGRYMIENSTGDIYGIKGYGTINKSHYYGNLETINIYYWGTYTARRIKEYREIDFDNLNSVDQELINRENAKFEAEVIDTIETEEIEIAEPVKENNKNSVQIQLEKDIEYLEATKERREYNRKQWQYIKNDDQGTKLINKTTNESIEVKVKEKYLRYLLIHKKDNVVINYKITTFNDAYMYITCKRDGDEYEENWEQECEEFAKNNDYTLEDLFKAFNSCSQV